MTGVESDGLVHFMDLRMSARVELGRQRLAAGAVQALKPGDIVDFAARVGTPLDFVVNGARVAQGEVVIFNDRYGFRITRIYSLKERQRIDSV